MTIIDHDPRPSIADDGVRCVVCGELVYAIGNAWTHTEPGPALHVAAVGFPTWVIEHTSETCAWCDAIRWRTVTKAVQAAVFDGIADNSSRERSLRALLQTFNQMCKPVEP
jgi:hypothetical protein